MQQSLCYSFKVYLGRQKNEGSLRISSVNVINPQEVRTWSYLLKKSLMEKLLQIWSQLHGKLHF